MIIKTAMYARKTVAKGKVASINSFEKLNGSRKNIAKMDGGNTSEIKRTIFSL